MDYSNKNDYKYYVLVVNRNRGKFVDKYYRLSETEINALEYNIRKIYPKADFKKYRIRSFVDFTDIRPY